MRAELNPCCLRTSGGWTWGSGEVEPTRQTVSSPVAVWCGARLQDRELSSSSASISTSFVSPDDHSHLESPLCIWASDPQQKTLEMVKVLSSAESL